MPLQQFKILDSVRQHCPKGALNLRGGRSVRQHGPKAALNLSGGRSVRQHSPEEALKLNGGRSPGANTDVMAAIGCIVGVCGKTII